MELKDHLSLCIRARYPILFLITWEEKRAEDMIREICKDLKKQVVTWTLSQGFQPDDGMSKTAKPEDALKYIASCDLKAIFVLKDFHPFLENETVVRLLRDLAILLKTSYKTIILISPNLKIPTDLEKDVTVYDFPLPNAQELNTVLKNLLAPFLNSKDVKINLTPELTEKVVQATLGLTRNEAENVFAKALLKDNNFGPDDLPDIIAEKKQLIRKSGILDFIGFSTKMNDVGGLDELKKWLNQRAMSFSDKARRYGLPAPKGLLLLGVQGCGKSLAAKSIAAEWSLPLLRLDVGKIFNSFIGDSEKNMRNAINLAETMSPAILWLDEIEKGFSGTQSSGSVDAGVTARVFATFLTWMQEKEKPVFVIATANNLDQLPPELLRKGRFDEIFFIDLPSFEERVQILKIHIQVRKRNPDSYDLNRLAEQAKEFSGAEIEQAIVSAMYTAFPQNRDFTTDDVLQAVKETVPLAVTAREKVEELREWAGQRARSASRQNNP